MDAEVVVLACAAPTIGRKGEGEEHKPEPIAQKHLRKCRRWHDLTVPEYLNTDMTVLKYVPLFTERVKLQLRRKLFNAFNRTNFNDPKANPSPSTVAVLPVRELGV